MIELLGLVVGFMFFLRRLPFSVILILLIAMAIVVFMGSEGGTPGISSQDVFLNQCSAHSTIQSCKQYGKSCIGLEEAFDDDEEWFKYRKMYCVSPTNADKLRLIRSYSEGKMGLFGAECEDVIERIQNKINSFSCDSLSSIKSPNPQSWDTWTSSLPWVAVAGILMILGFRSIPRKSDAPSIA